MLAIEGHGWNWEGDAEGKDAGMNENRRQERRGVYEVLKCNRGARAAQLSPKRGTSLSRELRSLQAQKPPSNFNLWLASESLAQTITESRSGSSMYKSTSKQALLSHIISLSTLPVNCAHCPWPHGHPLSTEHSTLTPTSVLHIRLL